LIGFIRGVAASLAYFLAVPALSAAASCELPPDYRADLRTDPEGHPATVRIGVLVADITEIDDVRQSLEGDFIIRKTRSDPWLADVAGCGFQRSEVWFPFTDVLESNELRRSRGQFAADQVSVEPAGKVEYFQRFFGGIATYHQLQQFPFDHHRMDIRVAAFEDPAGRAQLELDTDFTRLADLPNIPDWTISGREPRVEELILGSTVLVFGALVQVTVTSILITRGQVELALRMDRICRWPFPADLAAIWAIVLA